jgi:hypothetical protein
MGNKRFIDTAAQRTDIADVRGAFSFIPGLPESEVRLYGEAAFSWDDTSWYRSGSLTDKHIFGHAVFAGISATMSPLSALALSMDLRFIRNKKNFCNELAQSPAFTGVRIMNIESDSLVNTNFYANHYSTFDALYHHVFKFCPSEETNLWHKAPFTKSSYASKVYTQDELKGLQDSLVDPAVQLVMPFGPATPDRQGVRGNIGVELERAGVEARLLFSLLSGERKLAEMKRDTQQPVYSELGVGGSFDASAVTDQLTYPLVVSASFIRSRKNMDSLLTVDHVTAGLYWQFLKRLSCNAGIQNITCTLGDRQLRQTCLLGGGIWHLTRGANVYGTLGWIWVDNDYGLDKSPHSFTLGKFSQMITEVMFNVEF